MTCPQTTITQDPRWGILQELWEPRGEKEQAMGSDCLSFFKKEAHLSRLRDWTPSTLVHALLPEEGFGQTRCKVRQFMSGSWPFLRVPLQTVVAAISLGTSPLFREPKGKLLWVQTWDAPRCYLLCAECVGLWHHKQSPYSVASSYGHAAAGWWKPGRRRKPWLRKRSCTYWESTSLWKRWIPMQRGWDLVKKRTQSCTGSSLKSPSLLALPSSPGVLCTVLGALGSRCSEVSGRSPGLWARISGWVLAP